MMMRRMTTVGVLLAAVLVMGAGVAKAQTVTFAVPSGANVSTGADFAVRTGVVDGARSFTSSCMQSHGFGADHPAYRVVVVNTDNTNVAGAAASPAASIVSAYTNTPIPAGTRLDSLYQVGSCVDAGTTWNIYRADIASPQKSEVALIITPAGVTLTGDHEGVVGAGTDEFGVADAVCVMKGSQAIQSPILSDIPLEAGDRLTSFCEVDYDAETGETRYACWLEY